MSQANINTQLQVFVNPEFGEIRAVIIDGEPWLVGKDVALALGYKDTINALKAHVDAEDKKRGWQITTPSGEQQMTVINESGLYALVLSGKLPSSKKFKRWVTSEVLPAIRKTGMYQMPGFGRMSDFDIAMVLARTPKTRLPTVLQFLQSRGYDMTGMTPAVALAPAKARQDDGGIQRFVDEIMPQLQRDLQPFGVLYALYKAWAVAEHVTNCPLGKNIFIKQVANLAESGKISGWYTRGRKTPVRPKRLMAVNEPVLVKYHVDAGNDEVKATYTGLLRQGF